VRGERGIGPYRRTLQRVRFRIEFLHPPDRVLDVVDFDAEMVEAAGAPVAPGNVGHAGITVAERDRALRRQPIGLSLLHAEQGFVEAGVDRVMVAGDGDVIDARGHRVLPGCFAQIVAQDSGFVSARS
jgi:hypothetical protein